MIGKLPKYLTMAEISQKWPKKKVHLSLTKMLKINFSKHISGLSYIKAAKNPFRLNHLEFFHFLTRPNEHYSVRES